MTLRLGLILASLAAFVVFVGVALHWREEAARQRARADAAVLQSGVDTSTAAIADKVASDRVVIITQAEERADEVEAIPSDDVPADVLAAWRGSLRYAGGQRANADGSGELQGAVPEPQP
jgi:hypothetical protein